ncbi:hypothetical protein [Microbispora sp. ATCC PTA-5024]|uniref:hypothetical protein n=1 Tax=Microbispora sp. ATCC PTA-5024 TaxID=316330 RepID=UPI0003DDC040|nr:hypothetical protein [Microbispora sp. ATCC PTA-5024]ETK33277.1 hypothetical protein MPTA5024_25140 [Microbispora sp. ATCC PTA-5024]
MGEFVGLNPDGARRLCATMGDVLGRVPGLKKALAEGIGEAGTDYPSTARGAEVLDRSGSFLTDSRRDLTWRIQTITSVPGNTRVGEDFRTATFVFEGPDQARDAGAEAGRRLKEAYEAYQKDGTRQNWETVMAALEAATATGDPEYAAGFLNGATPAAVRGVFFAWIDGNTDPQSLGLKPDDLERFKTEMGPLIQAFASADAAGLATATHKFLVEHGSPDLISALLAAAPQSTSFVVDAGQYLLWAATTTGGRPGGNWRLRWFLQGVAENPDALQQLLAKDPQNAELLLRPDVSGDHVTPEVHALLVKALENALAPGAGPDARRRAAFYNVTKVYADRAGWGMLGDDPELKAVFVTALQRELDDPATGKTSFQEVAKIFSHSGKPPSILKDEQVNHIFTDHLKAYLPEISRLQAWRHDPKLSGMDPGAGWDAALSEDDLANLFAGVFQRRESVDAVMDAFRGYLSTVDVGGGNLDDPKDREKFTLAMAQASGLGGLMVSAVHELDMNAEAQRRLTVEMMILPIDLTIGRLGKLVPGEVTSTMWKNLLEDALKWPVTGRLAKDLDSDDGFFASLPLVGGLFRHGNENGEASDLAKALADEQLARYKQRLADAGKPPLSAADEVLLLNAIQGFYFEPVLDALKKRGG